jgi:arabinogalactan endo-1,4-beta-galactosidase
MSASEKEIHNNCLNRFIDLANTMKNEGIKVDLVSRGMMTAAALYATFAIAGNEGGLTESGVEKMSELFKQDLQQVQASKKARQGGKSSH